MPKKLLKVIRHNLKTNFNIYRVIRSFNCEDCPKPIINKTPCNNGFRIRLMIFFTRPWRKNLQTSNKCIKRVFKQIENCVMSDFDHDGN